ncbi:MAG: hypothetical protein IK114_12375 [Fibrobacter sp.]|nr:hypothetical protein [Fibrobacter sp.]
MMKELLFNLIRKHKYNISIYTEEIFERRCQEEIIRSDEDNSSFVYLEFDFETLKRELPDEGNFIQFWDSFFSVLSSGSRGSDIIGFLEHESGLGMLLLDSKLDGWERIKGRIEQKSAVNNLEKVSDILDKTVKPILYPACIQNMAPQATAAI